MKTQLFLLVSGMLVCMPPHARGDAECLPPPAGLVGWWPGEGSALDLVADASGTNQGGVFYTDAVVGQGFGFDSSDDGVVVPHCDALNIPTNGFSVELWMQGAQNQPRDPMALIVQFGGWEVQVSRYWGGAAFFNIGAGSVHGTSNVLDGRFHHLAGTWDGSTLRIYVDGQCQGSTALASVANSTHPLRLGFTEAGGNCYSFRGILDEITLYHRALTTNEITAIVAAGAGGKCISGPPVMCASPEDQIRRERESVEFAVKAFSIWPLSYQWFKGDVTLADDARLRGATSNTLQLTGLELADTGSYRVRVTNELGTTWSSEATLTVLTNPLPSPWRERDIGPAVQPPGFASVSNGVFMIGNAGFGWHATRGDQFHFVYQPLPREGGMQVRVGSVGSAAALTIRENLGTDPCREVWMLYSKYLGFYSLRLYWRAEPAEYAYSGFLAGAPWLKLRRAGDWFSAFVSSDAIDWTFAGATRVPMSDQVYVGMAAAGSPLPSTFDQPGVWSGPEPAPLLSLRREVWFDVAGSAAFAGPPGLTDSLLAFESEGLGTNYGQRLSGYLLAPETGPYVFHLASDDAAQLWLSSDEDPANRVLIVEEPVAGARRDWSKRVSAPVTLQAGGLYYLEALHKQDIGGDYLGVAWTLPYRLAPANGSEPIPGNQLYCQLPEGLPRIAQSPSGCTTVAGVDVSFAVQAEGPPLSYQWRKDDQDLHDNARLTGAGTATLTLTKVQPSDAGRYTVVVRNLVGSVESLPAELSVSLPYGEQPIAPLQLRVEPASPSGTWLCWPDAWAAASVETSEDLSDPASWLPWNVTPQQSQDQWWVWLSTTNQQRFFRLRASTLPQPPVAVPPEPATIAPVLPASVVTTMGKAIEFLYTGPDAVQLGVTNGTIQAEQAGVVRGRVITRDGAALAGVDVRIAGHSEFGFTRSRADGGFDLAVNGGLLTVRLERTGYLSAQRQINVPWQDYAQLEDIALVPQDSVVTPIDLASAIPVPVARGSAVADQDGARTATLLFPQGTHATLTLPDGSTQPLTTLHVRATEYTVGPNGPKAMPAELPPTIGYTYCVELGVDEADAVGATAVTFNHPIPLYVENFLGFPVGGLVPVGYYDKDRAEWVPSANGRVIKILGQTAGLADLDIAGSNVVADAASLAALGITDAERARLAGLYAPGQTLWRAPIPHLSIWDVNWGWGPPLDALFPLIPPWLYEDPQPEKECPAQSQRCQRSVPLTGTPYTLNYSSDRTPGNTAANTVEIPYSHTDVPPSTKRIDLVIEVNGRKFTNSFAATPNGRFKFLWDGQDAYGRPVQGCQKVTIRIGFVYDGGYQSPADLENTFGLHSFMPEEVTVRSRQEVTLWKELTSFVGGWHSHGLGFGGWSLNHHHAYDPNSRTVYYGDGRKRAVFNGASGDRTINVSAGGGTDVGYGVPAQQANLRDPRGIAVAPNGELYISDFGHHRIVKVDRSGLVRGVAGTYTSVGAFAGDGGPALNARLNGPTSLAFGPDGSLYLNDSGNDRIRRIAPSGSITTVAGGGTPADGLGDGGLATSALLIDPAGIAVGRDGRLFIADYGHHRVRVVSPGGIIETAVGGGESLAEGAAAAKAKLVSPIGIALAPDGTLYVTDSAGRRNYQIGTSEICRVDPLGRVFLHSGGRGNQPPWNGIGAIGSALAGPALAVGPDGDLYCDGWFSGTIIAKIRNDGLIQHVAGKLYLSGTSGDGGPAIGASMLGVSAIAFGHDGKLYFTDGGGNQMFGYPQLIRHVTLPLPGVTGDSIRLPSEDGAEVFVFDPSGRHLQTLDALTGAARDTFQYDASGLLTSVTDGDGNLTRIERAPDGRPTAVVGPFGQQTTLETDADGNLSRITDPANLTHQFTYRAGGLLETATDPRTNGFRFDYDSEGRLVRDEITDCCAGQLARTSTNGITTVAATSPEGRLTTYTSQTLLTGEVRQRNLFPDGTAKETLFGIDASRITTFADGTLLTEQDGGDARFGMEAPLLKSMTIRTPGGLTRSLSVDQQLHLSNLIDPFSLVGLITNTTVVNNRTNVARYDPATRTLTNITPEGRETVTIADAQRRPATLRVPGLEAVQITYDAHGRLARTMQGARQSGLAYDAATGHLTAITNALGEVTAYQRDAVGRVTTLVMPDGSSWAHAWDANDSLLMLTEPNGTNHHQFTYTAQDLMETYRSPLGATETFTYSKDQELIRRQFPSGRVVQWNYATNGQLASIQTPEGSHLFTYHATNGLLASATSRDGQQMDFAYDGNLLTNAMWSGVVTGAIRYVFDNDLRVAQMAYAGLTLTNGFDGDGLLTNVGTIHLPRNPTNGLLSGINDGAFTIAYQWNEFGEITNTVASQDAELYRVDRSYDAPGRIMRKVETIAGTTVTWDYAYDTVGQLVEVQRGGATVEAYAYDAVGNRIGMTNRLTGQILAASDYRYDADQKLLQAGATTFTYDVDGRLSTSTRAGAATTLHYNTDGTLAGVDLPDGRHITYLHDSQRRRIARAVDGVRTHAWLYGDGLMPLAEYDGTGALRTTFLYAGRWTPVGFIRNGATNHIVTDQLGSPRLVVDASDAVIKRLDYDAFGNVLLDTAPALDLPFGFAGGTADPDQELIRFGARDYQPSTGRWTAKDPILIGGGFRLYGYLANDPLNRTDRAGLQENAGCRSGGFRRFLDSLSHMGQAAVPLNVGLQAANALLEMHEQWSYSAWSQQIERRYEEEVIGPFLAAPSNQDGVDEVALARLRLRSTQQKAAYLAEKDVQKRDEDLQSTSQSAIGTDG